ncbi:MAG: SEL1-like repeat protein, partial [Alphaproteobacteria bacterium]
LVRRAANLGHAGAQRYLASLYKAGRAGVAKDLAEARRWYERAAASGDRQAMHETGLMQHFGEGGPVNLVSAAEWFHRAADLGSTDSQFNLAALYETGSGVGVNPAEAYKWCLLAARDTDEAKRTQARDAAGRVKAQLSATEQTTAERFAASFIPQTANASVTTRAAAPDYLTIQRALARLGYFKGAQNGVANDDLAAAVREYQHDQGLAATGVLDPTTTARLKTAAR